MKSKIFWIGRKKTGIYVIMTSETEPMYNNTSECFNRASQIFMCGRRFHRISGMKLKKGESAKFKLVKVK